MEVWVGRVPTWPLLTSLDWGVPGVGGKLGYLGVELGGSVGDLLGTWGDLWNRCWKVGEIVGKVVGISPKLLELW